MEKNLNYIELDRQTFQQKQSEIQDVLLKQKTGMIRTIDDSTKESIFYMLCFCICVPQARAIKVQEAINELTDKDFFNQHLSIEEITTITRSKVRFQNRKSLFLFRGKETFKNIGWDLLIEYSKIWPNLSLNDKRIFRAKWSHIFMGVGFKEASHFARNVGLHGLGILDVHVMKSLFDRKLIPCTALTRANYSDIEDIMIKYASDVGITLEELDLLFWSNKTGFVFK